MKRNLMNELKEGMDALAEKKQQEKKRVYIVFKDEYDVDRKFVDVLFTRQAAEDYVSGFTYRHKYYIEEYEETDNGRSKEIY
jgi:hypothetical protein